MSQLRDLVAKLRLDTAPLKAGLRGASIKAAGVASCLCAALTAPLCAALAVGTLWEQVQNIGARLPAPPMAPWVRVGGLDGRSGLAAMPHPNESPVDQARGQGEAARVVQPGIVQDAVGATYRALRAVKPQ